MSTYQKPVATLIDTTAEGIYMASGDADSSGISASFTKKMNKAGVKPDKLILT